MSETKRVPVEPTDLMLCAARCVWDAAQDDVWMSDLYKAMIAAAPPEDELARLRPITKRPKVGRGVLCWSPSNKTWYMAYWDGKQFKPWTPGWTELENFSRWTQVPAPVKEQGDE